MSDVVEKTLTALPGLFDSQTGAAKITNRLKQLIKSITELTSKHVSKINIYHRRMHRCRYCHVIYILGYLTSDSRAM